MMRSQVFLRPSRLTGAGLAIALAGCATTSDVVPPSWAATPDPERLAAASPDFADYVGISGRARLKCEATVTGALENCSVVSESPAGLGFGAAALSVADAFRARPATRRGGPVPHEVTFGVSFAMESPEPVLPWMGPEPDAEALSLARQVVAQLNLSIAGGPEAMPLGGLDADRVETVREIAVAVDRETVTALREAYALSLARTQSIANLRLLTRGQRRPSLPDMTDETTARAHDELFTVSESQIARFKALYCARYGCDAN